MAGRLAAEDVMEGLTTVLRVTKAASTAFPPLESAAGGLLEIINVVSVSAATS